MVKLFVIISLFVLSPIIHAESLDKKPALDHLIQIPVGYYKGQIVNNKMICGVQVSEFSGNESRIFRIYYANPKTQYVFVLSRDGAEELTRFETIQSMNVFEVKRGSRTDTLNVFWNESGDRVESIYIHNDNKKGFVIPPGARCNLR